MKSHVHFRQAVEGRKLEILLSPDDIAQLVSSGNSSLTLHDDNCEWDGEENVTYRNNNGETFKIAQITLGHRYAN